MLRYVEEKTIREIAVILDKKEGTVKSLLSRGIRKLREKMQPFHSDSVIADEGKQPIITTSKGTYEAQRTV